MGMIRHQQYLDHFKQLLANPEKHITDLSLNCDETTTNERHFHILQPIVARRQTDDLAHFLNFLEEHGLNWITGLMKICLQWDTLILCHLHVPIICHIHGVHMQHVLLPLTEALCPLTQLQWAPCPPWSQKNKRRRPTKARRGGALDRTCRMHACAISLCGSFVCSTYQGGLDNKIRTFGWIIAKKKTIMFKCEGPVDGPLIRRHPPAANSTASRRLYFWFPRYLVIGDNVINALFAGKRIAELPYVESYNGAPWSTRT